MLGGLLGIGGGALVVPGLVFFLNFDQHRAHGTSLAVVLAMSVASVATYWREGHIDWLLAGEMAAGGVMGAFLGTKAAAAIHSGLLRRVFSVFMLLVGVRMIVGGCLGQDPAHQAHHAILAGNALVYVLLVLATGVLTGFFSGLLGIGGGTVMVPAMVLLLCVDQHTAQGVSLAAMMPTALTGTLLHHDMGNVEFGVARWIGLGAIVGGVTGASVAGSLHAATLKLVFGAFLAIMAVLMALKK